MPRCGFLHSDISGSYECTLLAGAFRSVPRPSSALDAKAFTVRSCSFSAMCCGEIVLLALRFVSFAMHLVKCDRKTSSVPTKSLLSIPVVHRSIAITIVVEMLRRTTCFVNLLTLTRDENDPTSGRAANRATTLYVCYLPILFACASRLYPNAFVPFFQHDCILLAY